MILLLLRSASAAGIHTHSGSLLHLQDMFAYTVSSFFLSFGAVALEMVKSKHVFIVSAFYSKVKKYPNK